MSQITQTNPLSVTAYATSIARAVRATGAATIEGEIQKPRKTGGGALMFDATDGESCLKCKVLPWTLRDGISHMPKDGDLVKLTVKEPEFWPKAGILSVLVEDIELAGDGELLKRRQQLIDRFEAEGLADRSTLPPLPRFPSTVGVVAGVGSDALEDILKGLRDRFPAVHVVTACCQVQGLGAPRAVISVMAELDRHPDVEVIVVARGGGSVKDLAAFDDEGLCRAIRAISTPVVAAIGHTTDEPVCNFITHAASVPRHAPELLVPDRKALLLELDEFHAAGGRSTTAIRQRGEHLNALAHALRGSARITAFQRGLAERGRALDRVSTAFMTDAESAISSSREALAKTPVRVRAETADRRRHLSDFEAARRRVSSRPRELAAEVNGLGQRLSGAGARVLGERKTNWLRALDRQGESVLSLSRRRLTVLESELEHNGSNLARASARSLGERKPRSSARDDRGGRAGPRPRSGTRRRPPGRLGRRRRAG